MGKGYSVNDKSDYYLGCIIGDAISLLIGAGASISGIASIIGSIIAGGGVTISSFGTLTIGGVAIAVSGVVAGTAQITYGGIVVTSSISNFGNDIKMFSEYSKGGSNGGNIKNVYNSIKEAPKYPKGFEPVQNGTEKIKVKNGELLDNLRKIESGEWNKIYKDGYVDGKRVSIHYFQSKSGKVFDVDVKTG